MAHGTRLRTYQCYPPDQEQSNLASKLKAFICTGELCFVLSLQMPAIDHRAEL